MVEWKFHNSRGNLPHGMRENQGLQNFENFQSGRTWQPILLKLKRSSENKERKSFWNFWANRLARRELGGRTPIEMRIICKLLRWWILIKFRFRHTVQRNFDLLLIAGMERPVYYRLCRNLTGQLPNVWELEFLNEVIDPSEDNWGHKTYPICF